MISDCLLQSKRLLLALVSTSNQSARESVLTLALISLDHNDEDVHDEEIKFGADAILVKCLRRSVFEDVESRETEQLCRLLKAVYKCSDSIAVSSFSQHGTVLLPLLVSVASNAPLMSVSQVISKKLLQRTKPGGVSLSSMKDSDLLTITLVRLLRNGMANCQQYTLIALDCLTLHPDSKAIVARYPGLLEAIVKAGRICTLQALTVIVNLAWDSGNKEALVETGGLLNLFRTACESIDENVRLLVSSSLNLLSSETSVKDVIVEYESGALLQHLMILLNDSVLKTRINSLQCLSNLVCESTASIIGNTPKLLTELRNIGTSTTLDAVEGVIASKILKRLSVYIHTRDKCHQELCNELVRMSTNTGLDVPMWTARAFVEQSLKMSSSFFMVRNEPTLSALMHLATSKYGRVRACAVEAISNLAQEPANARRLSTNDDIFQVLIQNINSVDDDNGNDDARREAVRGILLLASHRTASKRTAKQLGIIQSLSRYGTSVDGDVELKRAALHGVLVLAPSM